MESEKSSPDNRPVYLNGEFLPLSEARISVMDRGFLFGDGVYEVIPAYGGHLLRLEQHLERLTNSLRAIYMLNPLSSARWKEVLYRLIEADAKSDQSIYLQVTRGALDTRDHNIPDVIEPTVFAMCNPILPMSKTVRSHGVAAVTLDDVRWHLCDIKAVTLLANVLLRQQARERQALEAILIRDGKATEGAASNLFIVVDGVLITPPKSPLLLAGITRDLVLELASRNTIAYSEQPISEAQLNTADEVWLTSSTREIMPVTRLNETPVGNGRPGQLWRRMYALYQEWKERLSADPQID